MEATNPQDLRGRKIAAVLGIAVGQWADDTWRASCAFVVSTAKSTFWFESHRDLTLSNFHGIKLGARQPLESIQIRQAMY